MCNEKRVLSWFKGCFQSNFLDVMYGYWTGVTNIITEGEVL